MSAATNSTGEYLKLHADIESEGSRSPVAVSPEVFDAAVDRVVHTLEIGPESTVADIAYLCAWFSTPEREVYARIEWSNGKPVAYLMRGEPDDFLPAFLRKQAG
jgi:hypothetical protein